MHDPVDEIVWKSLTENTTDIRKAAWDPILTWIKSRVQNDIRSFGFRDSYEEDVVMHVAEQMLKGKFGVRSIAELKGWVRKVATFKALDILKIQERYTVISGDESGESPGSLERAATVFRDQQIQADMAEEAQLVEEYALENLTIKELELLDLLKEYGLRESANEHSSQERQGVAIIAAKLGVTENTANQRISRLRKKLKRWRSELE